MDPCNLFWFTEGRNVVPLDRQQTNNTGSRSEANHSCATFTTSAFMGLTGERGGGVWPRVYFAGGPADNADAIWWRAPCVTQASGANVPLQTDICGVMRRLVAGPVVVVMLQKAGT